MVYCLVHTLVLFDSATRIGLTYLLSERFQVVRGTCSDVVVRQVNAVEDWQPQ